MTATLLVSLALFLRASQAFLDAHRLDGSWHSYSTCDLFLAPEPEPTGAPHSVTCSFKLLNVTSNEIWGQSLACTGGPSTHGKDYVYVELAQDGSVVTRIPGVHSKHGAYKFSGWSLVSWQQRKEACRHKHAPCALFNAHKRSMGIGEELQGGSQHFCTAPLS